MALMPAVGLVLSGWRWYGLIYLFFSHKKSSNIYYYSLKLNTMFLCTLQTPQNFLIQKMLQKALKICVIIPAFFDPENGGKI